MPRKRKAAGESPEKKSSEKNKKRRISSVKSPVAKRDSAGRFAKKAPANKTPRKKAPAKKANAMKPRAKKSSGRKTPARASSRTRTGGKTGDMDALVLHNALSGMNCFYEDELSDLLKCLPLIPKDGEYQPFHKLMTKPKPNEEEVRKYTNMIALAWKHARIVEQAEVLPHATDITEFRKLAFWLKKEDVERLSDASSEQGRFNVEYNRARAMKQLDDLDETGTDIAELSATYSSERYCGTLMKAKHEALSIYPTTNDATEANYLTGAIRALNENIMANNFVYSKVDKTVLLKVHVAISLCLCRSISESEGVLSDPRERTVREILAGHDEYTVNASSEDVPDAATAILSMYDSGSGPTADTLVLYTPRPDDAEAALVRAKNASRGIVYKDAP